MRVSPDRFELKPNHSVTAMVIPIDKTTWSSSLGVTMDGVVRLVRLEHKPVKAKPAIPQLVMSENVIDFGTVEPRSTSEKVLKLCNNDTITYSWLLQSVNNQGGVSAFTIGPREGVIEP